MRNVVYVDVLFLTNAVIGYLVLRCTAFLAGRETRPWRMCAAGVLAGLTSLLILWQDAPWAVALGLKCLGCTLIVATAFRLGTLRVFCKSVAWYTVLNLLLGGFVAFAVLCGAKKMTYRNFSLYLQISPLVLIACVLVMYGLIQAGTWVFGKAQPRQYVSFDMKLEGCAVRGMALLDNGQKLHDAITGENAALCSFASLETRLPAIHAQAIKMFFERGELQPPLWLVTVKTATGMRALPALRVEELSSEKKVRHHAVVVFTPEMLLDGGCDMMLHPDFLQER